MQWTSCWLAGPPPQSINHLLLKKSLHCPQGKVHSLLEAFLCHHKLITDDLTALSPTVSPPSIYIVIQVLWRNCAFEYLWFSHWLLCMPKMLFPFLIVSIFPSLKKDPVRILSLHSPFPIALCKCLHQERFWNALLSFMHLSVLLGYYRLMVSHCVFSSFGSAFWHS